MAKVGRPTGAVPDVDNERLVALGRKILSRREQIGLTQKQAAELVGVSGVGWQNWERARRAPGALQLAEIARVLECSADWLLGLSADI